MQKTRSNFNINFTFITTLHIYRISHVSLTTLVYLDEVEDNDWGAVSAEHLVEVLTRHTAVRVCLVHWVVNIHVQACV